jgi:cytochrome c oxidase subunit 1
MPRRYYHYAPEFQVFKRILHRRRLDPAVGYICFPLVYLVVSLRNGPEGAEPWGATGLEWKNAFTATDG